MKKNALIAAIALATISNTSFAQEEANTACMSEPQRVEISSRETEYTCDALNGGEAVLATRLNSSFARYFLDGTRKALITGLGTDNEVRPFSRRSAPFTDNDQALIDELLAAYTADIEGSSQPEGSSSSTNVSTAIASVSSNADNNTTTVDTSTSGNASVNGSASNNGVTQGVSDSSGSAPQVAAPAESTPTPAPTQSTPAPSTNSGASVRISANSTDGVTAIDTATNGNARLNGTVSNNGESQNVSDSSGSLATPVTTPAAPVTAPVTTPAEDAAPRRGASNSTVRISSNSADGTTTVDSDTNGNSSISGIVRNNGSTVDVNEGSGSLSPDLSDLDDSSTSTNTVTQRSGTTQSRVAISSSANSDGEINTTIEREGDTSGTGQASGGGNSQSTSF